MDEKIFFSDKEPKTIAELKAIGGINLPVFKDGKKMYKTSLDELLSASPNTVIKDNARDDVTDPIHPDNITDIEQLIFVRNVGADANYTMVESEERPYGVLIPHPSMEADRGKVPMYKTGNQIAWETPPTQDLASLTITPVIVDTTATLTIEQGGFASIDLTSEAALTAVSVVLTNTSGVAMPVWWFKIKAGSDITLSVKIGAVAVGWLGSAITNIALGKTIEINVVDNVACGGELV